MTCAVCVPWADGGCDFGCPCADCESGRRAEYEATQMARPWAPPCGDTECNGCKTCDEADAQLTDEQKYGVSNADFI